MGSVLSYPSEFASKSAVDYASIGDDRAKKEFDVRLSGAHWRNIATAKGFVKSNKIGDLVEPFRSNAEKFIEALKSAGIQPSISTTSRSVERAWLMRHAWLIAKGKKPPTDDPYATGIVWDHGSAAATKKAAKKMSEKFKLRQAASLDSRHIHKAAIDMTINWTGDLKIKNALGQEVIIKSSPRNGWNSELHQVGASYGVHKLNDGVDEPHWSDNGS